MIHLFSIRELLLLHFSHFSRRQQSGLGRVTRGREVMEGEAGSEEAVGGEDNLGES